MSTKGHRCDPCKAHHRPCDGVRTVCGACHFRQGRSDAEECHWSHNRPPPAHLRRTAKRPRRDHPRPEEPSSDNDDPTATNEDLSNDEEEVTSAALSDAALDSTAPSLPPSQSFTQIDQHTLQPRAPETPQASGHYNPFEPRLPSSQTAEGIPIQYSEYPAPQASLIHTHIHRRIMDSRLAPSTDQVPRRSPSPLDGETAGSARHNAIDPAAGTEMGQEDAGPAGARQPEPFRSTITPASVLSGELPPDGIAIRNADRGLARYMHQTTSHFTVDPSDPRWNYRQSRVVVIGEGEARMMWEYPFRPGKPTFPMTADEARPFLYSASGRQLLGGMPEVDEDIFDQQPPADAVHNPIRPNDTARATVGADNIGQQQESVDNGGNAGSGAEDAEEDSWMEEFVDLDGKAN